MPGYTSNVLDEEQIHSLSHEDLVQYAINITGMYKALNQRMDELEAKVAVSSHCNDILSKRLERNERQTIKVGQYSKNRQIEIHKVPDSISKEDLPAKIAGVLTLTGNDVVTDDFVKCHRIKSKQDSVIAEFKWEKRNLRDDVIKSRKNLKTKKSSMKDLGFTNGIVVTESLTDGFVILDGILHKLQVCDHIMDKWFWMGTMFFRANNGVVHVVKHLHDIYAGVEEEVKPVVDQFYLKKDQNSDLEKTG